MSKQIHVGHQAGYFQMRVLPSLDNKKVELASLDGLQKFTLQKQMFAFLELGQDAIVTVVVTRVAEIVEESPLIIPGKTN